MAIRTVTGANQNLTTDLGGTVSGGDTVYVGFGSVNYNNASGNDLSAADLVLFETRPGWDGSIASGAPLKLVCNQTNTGIARLHWAGREIYLQSSSGSGVIYRIEIAPTGGGKVFLSTCDNEILIQTAGVLEAEATADLENVYVMNRAQALLKESGPEMTTLRVGGDARVECQRDFVNGYVSGAGQLRVTRAAVTPSILEFNGGYVDWRGGNITDLYVYGANNVLDLRGMPTVLTVSNKRFRGFLEIWLTADQPEPTFSSTVDEYVKARIVRK